MKPLDIESDYLKEAFDIILEHPTLMFQIPYFQGFFAKKRIEQLKEEDISVLENPSDGVNEVAIPHNLTGLKDEGALYRPFRLISPLVAIDYIANNIGDLKVLAIGPRTESEIFSLIGIGFRPQNITAVDLISYSELIELGDVHNLKYEDESFDITIAGWVLAYSQDNQKAANEIARVTKSGGFVAVGCVSEPLKSEKAREQAMGLYGGLPQETIDPNLPGKLVSRFFHVQQILNLFANCMDEVIFCHNHDPRLMDKRSNAIVIFRKK